MHKIHIKVINFGIAFRIKDTIYLHKNLKNYPELRKKLINHELEHTNNFKLSDIKTDLTGSHLKSVKKDYYKFLIKEPKAWYQLLPILRIEKKWTIDLIMMLFWTVSLIIGFLIIRN